MTEPLLDYARTRFLHCPERILDFVIAKIEGFCANKRPGYLESKKTQVYLDLLRTIRDSPLSSDQAIERAVAQLPPTSYSTVNIQPLPWVVPFVQAYSVWRTTQHHYPQIHLHLALQVALHCRAQGRDYYEIRGDEDQVDRALIAHLTSNHRKPKHAWDLKANNDSTAIVLCSEMIDAEVIDESNLLHADE